MRRMGLKRKAGVKDGVVRTMAAVGVGAVVLYGSKALINLFGPQPKYSMKQDLDAALDSEKFIQFLSVVTNGPRRHSRLERLKNGTEFYPAEMEAIQRAKRAVNLEFYEFSRGEVSGRMLEALSERARAGVEVKLIVDAMGSFQTPDSYFDGLRAAGGQMCWYHPAKWDTWQHLNQRTHRKMMTVDGETGFIGGAGVADHWLMATKQGPAWRDTMFCVEGEVVAGLISTFCENWLEASGEIVSGQKQFGFHERPEGAQGFVVASTPQGGGTQARILFQALINSARESIRITTPYFLPDRSARQALIAARQRGVKVQVLTAGPKIDHPFVLKLSRHSSRRLLRGGAEIFEYQPSMIHAKLMTVDHQWSVVGSTNFDHRSFALNDEVNLAVLDRNLAEVIEGDFDDDLKQSRALTLAMLGSHGPMDQAVDLLDKAEEAES
jgi:cardiolipin synthase